MSSKRNNGVMKGAKLRVALYNSTATFKDDSVVGNQMFKIKVAAQKKIKNSGECDFLSFVDNGCSRADSSRSAFKRLCGMIKKKKIDVVFFNDLSRVSRGNLSLSEELLSLCRKHKVRVVSLDGKFDSSTSHGEAFIDLMLFILEKRD